MSTKIFRHQIKSAEHSRNINILNHLELVIIYYRPDVD